MMGLGIQGPPSVNQNSRIPFLPLDPGPDAISPKAPLATEFSALVVSLSGVGEGTSMHSGRRLPTFSIPSWLRQAPGGSLLVYGGLRCCRPAPWLDGKVQGSTPVQADRALTAPGCGLRQQRPQLCAAG